MNNYYRTNDYDINLIKTILIVYDELGKDRTNKLISILNKKTNKRYNPKGKIKDNQKTLKKYKTNNLKK